MKFLLITLEYFPFKGGVANYYTNLVYYWPKTSEISVLNNNNNELLKKRGFFKWTKALFKLYSQVKKKEIDYVIVGNILPLGLVTYIVSKIIKIKYTVVLHGMDFSWALKKKRKKFISQLILKRADKIITANSYVAELCTKLIGNNGKIMTINPGIKDFSNFNINSQDLREKNGLVGYKIIFSLGRLVKRKGFDYTIKAIKKVLNEKPNIDLIYIIAGNGPDEDYLKKIAYEELGNNWEKYIKFIGGVDESTKWSLLSCCDIFIMPSRNIDGDFEGFGIVYLEANLCEKPVIAGRSGGVNDAVESGVNGLLVDPENVSEISQAILSLLDKDFLRIKMGQVGRQRALEKFNWKNQIEKIYNFLNNLK
jgi:phosphatidylinositol alpha-1,6-mannosyltransferase